MIFGKYINRYYLRHAPTLLLGIAALILVDYMQLIIPELYRMLINGVNSGQVLVGDVAFATAQEQAACREKAGADWDAEEYYPVAEQLRPLFPDLRFEKISHCAGVFVFGGERKN